jgi:subtilisin family serine protease
LGDAHPLRTEGAITREWAFGDGLGAYPNARFLWSHRDPAMVIGSVCSLIHYTRSWSSDRDDAAGLGPDDSTRTCTATAPHAPGSSAPSPRGRAVQRASARSRAHGRASVFAAGLRWAIENDMDVVNLSLSTSRGEWYGTFHELVDLAYFRRCVVVSAMNNLRMPTFPSEFASVVSVAAHSGTNSERFEYNPDGPAEFGAPGIDVEVAWSGGGTLEVTGNSFAAPHIAGMVARIMGQHPDATPFQVKTILHALADNARR